MLFPWIPIVWKVTKFQQYFYGVQIYTKLHRNPSKNSPPAMTAAAANRPSAHNLHPSCLMSSNNITWQRVVSPKLLCVYDFHHASIPWSFFLHAIGHSIFKTDISTMTMIHHCHCWTLCLPLQNLTPTSTQWYHLPASTYMNYSKASVAC